MTWKTYVIGTVAGAGLLYGAYALGTNSVSVGNGNVIAGKDVNGLTIVYVTPEQAQKLVGKDGKVALQPSAQPSPTAKPSLEEALDDAPKPAPQPRSHPRLSKALEEELKGSEVVDIFGNYQIEKRYENQANQLYKSIYNTVTRAYLGNDGMMPNILETVTNKKGLVDVKRLEHLRDLVCGDARPTQYGTDKEFINTVQDLMSAYSSD